MILKQVIICSLVALAVWAALEGISKLVGADFGYIPYITGMFVFGAFAGAMQKKSGKGSGQKSKRTQK